MDSENVYGTSLPDSMIRKFSKNGKLKLFVAIDPINSVSTIVPNKSSTKNTTAESKNSNSDWVCSIDREKGPQPQRGLVQRVLRQQEGEVDMKLLLGHWRYYLSYEQGVEKI